jgi:prevent-host-death family protein
MDVGVSELRANLSAWLDRARGGEQIVVTDRGIPVARLLGMSATATLERLAAEGIIGRPERTQRPTASGRARPGARRSLAELVAEQRR